MENPDKKKYIFICTGSDCKKNGSKKLIKELSDYIKAEKSKSSVRIVKTKCLDHCKKGPNVIINNSLHHKVKEQEILSLIKNE
jgi:NADH:ubiquinone oxidoreductase subunit E